MIGLVWFLAEGILQDLLTLAIAVTGRPYQDPQKNLSITAMQKPVILAPSLQQVPEVFIDREARIRHRQGAQIVDPSERDIIFLRSKLIRGIRGFLEDEDFIETSTPLLVAGAGGATARPFETEATEFSGTKLRLRVAPELFLKRMIVGGVERVFEIGPAFRNEGRTHLLTSRDIKLIQI